MANEYRTIEDIEGEVYKPWESPAGHKYRLRRVSVFDLLDNEGGLPMVDIMAAGQAKSEAELAKAMTEIAKAGKLGDMTDIYKAFLVKGVASLRLVFEDPAPEGALCVDDFIRADMGEASDVMNEIITMSGMNLAALGVRPGSRFSDGGPASDSPDGTDVREAPARDSSPADGGVSVQPDSAPGGRKAD